MISKLLDFFIMRQKVTYVHTVENREELNFSKELYHPTRILHIINTDEAFHFFERYIRRELGQKLDKIEHKEWGESWWNFVYMDAAFTLNPMHIGSELYVDSIRYKDGNRHCFSDNEFDKYDQIVHELGLQIVKEYLQELAKKKNVGIEAQFIQSKGQKK